MDPVEFLLRQVIEEIKFHLNQKTVPTPLQLDQYLWRCERVLEELEYRRKDLEGEKMKF